MLVDQLRIGVGATDNYVPATTYTEYVPARAGGDQEPIMSNKAQRSNKETKKQPLLSSKEKRQAKHAKKHASDTVPINIPHH